MRRNPMRGPPLSPRGASPFAAPGLEASDGAAAPRIEPAAELGAVHHDGSALGGGYHAPSLPSHDPSAGFANGCRKAVTVPAGLL
jgi:hypothetical protein